MKLKSTVENITHTAVSTAVSAVRDPLGTASRATGLVKETAGAGIGLVRNRVGGVVEQAPAPVQDVVDEVVDKTEEVADQAEEVAEEVADKVADKVQQVAEQPAETEAPEGSEHPAETEDPRDNIPGPDLAAFAPPAPEDLPEPIVIEAE